MFCRKIQMAILAALPYHVSQVEGRTRTCERSIRETRVLENPPRARYEVHECEHPNPSSTIISTSRSCTALAGSRLIDGNRKTVS
ncbi:hypothetical protein GGS23DRAFT_363225 [Durotheca rogersii]|uniref:uncharacterized protein n=1 Tax=Durotheca rogersii TaxID=419775 RepID=UPI00221F421C|nr:uncharacterized protein GGS23DRAFT_363225 [Durotheca rogersii]KAI5865980.1 hypothetical protein GGS23DRAFT_363225 [Durotheca rogersii]